MHIAERWLRQQSRTVVAVETLQFLDALPAAGQHLIIPSAPGDLPLLEASQLLDWVLRGGHLVAVAPTNAPAPDQPYDLNPHAVTNCFDCLIDQPSPDSTAAEKAAWHDARDTTGRVTIKGLAEQPLRLWSQLALTVGKPSDKLTAWTSNGGATMVVRYPYGDGQVTLLPANQWLDNAQLIEPDHARLASALVADRSGTVFIQHYSIPGGLLPWLWRQAPAFWIGCLILLALWVWHRLPRLGPIGADPEPAPNQLRDRLRATARFDSKHGGGRALLEALREELAGHARYRYPDWHQLSTDERARRLGRLCPELTGEAIHTLLKLDRIEPADRLIELLATQRHLLRAL
jgi:hypothetical protein